MGVTSPVAGANASATDRGAGPGWIVLAGIWGCAEATLFFIVPDVLLSHAALTRGRTFGLRLALWSTLGAVLGGAAMYLWAARDPAAAYAALERVPAVSGRMLTTVDAGAVEGDLLAAITGPFRGTPYKLYAAAMGRHSAGLGTLVLLTPLARLPRFLVLVWLAAAGGGKLRRGSWLAEHKAQVLWAGWIAFYAAFWLLMPS